MLFGISQARRGLAAFVGLVLALTLSSWAHPFALGYAQRSSAGANAQRSAVHAVRARREAPRRPRWMIEYSSPNPNKPLHLGHMRNIAIGASLSQIAKATGKRVVRAQLLNDRGLHIARTLVAYERWGRGQTPESQGMKGDHFVGSLYVRFNAELSNEYGAWRQTPAGERAYREWLATRHGGPDAVGNGRDEFARDFERTYFHEHSALGRAALETLAGWDRGDRALRSRWLDLDRWATRGIFETYRRLGVRFDLTQRETDVASAGNDIITRGAAEGLLSFRGDGAIVANLEHVGLQGEEVLRRPNGTTGYMAQDLGLLRRRYLQGMDRIVYVVGDEQNQHFHALFGLAKRLRIFNRGAVPSAPRGPDLEHRSYGMIHLPNGVMKSRTGSVVEADALMDQLESQAREHLAGLERHNARDPDARADAARRLANAAWKFELLATPPRDHIRFDPQTGFRMHENIGFQALLLERELRALDPRSPRPTSPRSAALLQLSRDLPDAIARAEAALDPSIIANHTRALYEAIVAGRNETDAKVLRAAHSALKRSIELLGIELL